MSDCKHSFDDEGDCVACGAFIEDLDDGAVERIAELEAQLPRWIPCSERMPDRSASRRVLIYTPRYGVEEGYWSGDYFHRNGEQQPTHWMPLPPAPEGE